MFTGIVENEGRVLSVSKGRSITRVRIAMPRRWKLGRGQSIAVDGVCSTVVRAGKGFFEVEYMPETLKKTTAGSFEKGATTNLERSLRWGQRIDGHFVQGHVDTIVAVISVAKRGRSQEITFSLPRSFKRFVIEHGSVALNGVSLTIAKKSNGTFLVALVPYTIAHTNLGGLRVGDKVNVEFDRTHFLAPIRSRARVVSHAPKRTRKKT